MLFAEHAEELVNIEVKKAELRVGVAGQMQYNQTVAVADHTLDAEVVDGGHLCGDVVVLEVFGHLGEAAAAPEAEEGAAGGREGGEGRGRRAGSATVMYVNDSLSTHAEREATVLVKYSVTRQRALWEPRRFCISRTHTHHIY